MGEHVLRQTPGTMPTKAQIHKALEKSETNLLVAGCRGSEKSKNRQPHLDIHTNYTFSAGSLADLKQKHVILFLHGYNVDPAGALYSARLFFQLLDRSLVRDKQKLSACRNVLFTWPGDVGTIYFNDAQSFAHYSGVALYKLLVDIIAGGARTVSVVSHSLGAHVLLRALSILGERNFHGKIKARVDRALLLAAAVEDDVFSNPDSGVEYHFPEAAFGVRHLHMSTCRDDEVLAGAFRVNEFDRALGYSGPESMEPLASLSRRVTTVLGKTELFKFELHDFSQRSATIMDVNLHVRNHGDYWRNQDQTNYYVNLLQREFSV